MQKNIVIIGAGIAGCSLAYFLAKTGWHITLIESEDDIAKGGSGNPVAAIYPKFMLNDVAYNDFMLKSFMHTTAWISELGLSQDNYRFDGAIEILDATYAQKLAYNLSRKNLCQNNFFSLINESILDIYKLKRHQSGLFFHQGGWVNPIALCQHLINHSHIKIITKQKITSIENSISNWIVKTEDQRVFSAHDIAICNAGFVNQFEPTSHLQIDAFRGQINWIDATTLQMPSIVTSDIGYLFPRIHDKHVFGATYALNDFTKELRLSDTKKNIASIKEIHPDFYKECLAQESISGRVAWRASTKDRKPYVGSVFDAQILKKMRIRELTKAHQLPWLKNLYIASGFGSRGFTWAPYCTSVLANLINDNLSQEDKKTLNYTNPERYRLKKMSLKKIANHIFEV
jgi:tRNA U-34 5-methylaminomethyl-2-thiouridine biosynthesis protein MnmC